MAVNWMADTTFVTKILLMYIIIPMMRSGLFQLQTRIANLLISDIK